MDEEALAKLQSLRAAKTSEWGRRLLSFASEYHGHQTRPLPLPDSRNTSAGARCNPFRTEVCSRFWSGAVNGRMLCSLHFSTQQRFQEGVAEVGQAVSGPLCSGWTRGGTLALAPRDVSLAGWNWTLSVGWVTCTPGSFPEEGRTSALSQGVATPAWPRPGAAAVLAQVSQLWEEVPCAESQRGPGGRSLSWILFSGCTGAFVAASIRALSQGPIPAQAREGQGLTGTHAALPE